VRASVQMVGMTFSATRTIIPNAECKLMSSLRLRGGRAQISTKLESMATPQSVTLDESATRRESLLVAIALAAVVAIRFIAPTTTPSVSADEGTWPWTVRLFEAEGRLEPNFFTTPGYHLVLAIPFALFGPSLLVARVVSALVSVLNLVLVYNISLRLFGNRRVARWALLLLGVSYPALLIDRKAFIEPIQMAWLLALVFAYLGEGRKARIGIALATAGLLLTKAQAAFIVPALLLASLMEWRRSPWGSWGHLAALSVGIGLATTAFAGLYLIAPAKFVIGWGQKLYAKGLPDAGSPFRTHAAAPLLRLGRISIHPLVWDVKLRMIAGVEPFLVVGGTVGVIKALWMKRYSVLTAWLPMAMVSYLVVGPLDNHVAAALPAFAIAGPWFFLHGPPPKWRTSLLACALTIALARSVGGLMVGRDPDRFGVRWLRQQVTKDDVTLGATMILMQLPSRGISIFDIPGSFMPSCNDVRGHNVSWVAIDSREWGGYVRRKRGETPAAIVNNLHDCATRAFESPSLTVLKVNSGPTP